jgi:hypothetical protein
MALIDDVKVSNRVLSTDTGIVAELQDLIDAAKADLILSGILESKVIDTDTLIKRAIMLYSKAHFGLDNADSKKYEASYNSLKTHLCLSQEYTVEVVV